MSMAPTLTNWLDLFLHFASLSLLAVGGAITTAPDMHRYLVSEQGWLSEAQFTSSIALSQAAPGPNVLFVALLGWNLGLNAAGGPAAGAIAWWTALLGVLRSAELGARQDEINNLMRHEGERQLVLDGKRAAARVLAASMALFAIGTPVLRRYQAAKENAGLLDYDDLIAGARKLLDNPGSAWVFAGIFRIALDV